VKILVVLAAAGETLAAVGLGSHAVQHDVGVGDTREREIHPGDLNLLRMGGVTSVNPPQQSFALASELTREIHFHNNMGGGILPHSNCGAKW